MPRLIEVTELKSALGILLTDTSQDTYLGALADAASEIIELYLRRHLESKERTEVLHQYGDCLRLRGFPVTEVALIQTADGTEITDYQVIPETGLIYRAGGWPKTDLGYEVTYTGGFSTPYPKAFSQAALMVAVQLRTITGQGGMAAASERIGDYAVTYMTAKGGGSLASGLEGLNPAVAALLRLYMGGTL